MTSTLHRTLRALFSVALSVLLGVGTAGAQVLGSAHYTLDAEVGGSGGAGGSASYAVQGTVGMASGAGTLVSAHYTAAVGFWSATAVGSNAQLASLAVSAGQLAPAFAPGTASYGDSVPYAASSITLIATPVDPNASVSVGGGSASASIPLNVGANSIVVQVTAQDGVTQASYTVTVVRAAAGSSGLPNLSQGVAGVSSEPPAVDLTGSEGAVLLQQFDGLLSNALGLSLGGASQNPLTGGVVVSAGPGLNLGFRPLALRPGDPRPNGLYPVGDGTYQIVVGGIALTVAPTVPNLDQFAALLPPGSGLQITPTGVMVATVGGVTYAVQPSFAVGSGAASGAARIGIGADGRLHFTDAQGNDQILYPAMLEPATLGNDLLSIDPSAQLAIQPDGTAAVTLGGHAYVFLPDLTLQPVPPADAALAWWQDGPFHYAIRLGSVPGMAQGFTLAH